MSDPTKPDLSRVLGDLADSVARVIAGGDAKHGPDTWRALSPSDFIAAASRHLAAVKRGEYLDPESQEPHWAHVIVNAMYAHEVTSRVGREVPLDAQLRLQDVQRWHTVRMRGPNQSVAEHSYNVAAMGRRYLQIAGRHELIGPYLEMALVHDNEESLTGDVPSPAKAKAPPPETLLDYVLRVCDLQEAALFLQRYGEGVYAQQAMVRLLNDITDLVRGWTGRDVDPILELMMEEARDQVSMLENGEVVTWNET